MRPADGLTEPIGTERGRGGLVRAGGRQRDRQRHTRRVRVAGALALEGGGQVGTHIQLSFNKTATNTHL